MKLTINGDPRDFQEGIQLPALLAELGLTGKPVVIEVNQEALAPSEFAAHALSDGDSIEIITIAAGG